MTVLQPSPLFGPGSVESPSPENDVTTEYQLWIFHEFDGWFLRDFCDSVEDAQATYRLNFPSGQTSYRIVAVQVCR